MTRAKGPALPARVLLLAVVAASAVPGAAMAEEIRVTRDSAGIRLSNDPKASAPISRPVAPRGASGGVPFGGLIDHYSRHHGLDPELVRAVIQVESAFDPLARSRRGAMGLMQLMPDTARELEVGDVWDPEENIRGGTTYLRRMLDRFEGKLELALAGYNAGPSVVEKYGRVPPYRETVQYVDKVLGLYRGRGGSGITLAGMRTTRPVFVTRGEDNRIVFTTRD